MGLVIALDASAAAKKERTGVARYATCLIDALLDLVEDDRLVLGYRLRLKRHRYRYRPGGTRLRYFTDSMPAFSLGRPDVFHGLDARLPRGGRFPMVATLHDVGPLERAEIATQGFQDKKREAYRWLAERADRIICVSASTRDAFRRHFDLPESRFEVIHHGLEERFRPPPPDEVERTLRRLGIARPYLLFVGLLSARKNIANLVHAFDQAAADVQPLGLVLAGGRAHGFEEIDAVIGAADPDARQRIVMPGFVADDDLPALYAGAHAFAFPGLAEGFGMPMLEAMACGAPVLAADTAVSREVVSTENALLADARDVDALAAGIRTLGSDDALRARFIAAGREHAARFTWRAAAEKTLAVYREVARAASGDVARAASGDSS